MSSVFPCIDAKKPNNGFTLPRLSWSSSSPSSLAYISKRRGFKADHQRFHSSSALIISSSSNCSVFPYLYSNRKGLKADPATIPFFLAARRSSDLSNTSPLFPSAALKQSRFRVVILCKPFSASSLHMWNCLFAVRNMCSYHCLVRDRADIERPSDVSFQLHFFESPPTHPL